MDKEKLILRIWLYVVIVLVSFNVCQALFKMVKVYKITDASTLTFNYMGIGEIVLIASAYYTTKWLIKRE